MDWTPYDVIATDAGYRDATNADTFPGALRAQVARGKPFGVTEFGCGTFRGAAGLGGRGDSIVEWDDDARPVRIAAGTVRDEEEQAGYVREMLDIYDAAGVDAAFVYTFSRRDLAHDFDAASFGVVRVLPPGAAEGPYADLGWQPKAAFHVLAGFGRTRRERAAAATSPS